MKRLTTLAFVALLATACGGTEPLGPLTGTWAGESAGSESEPWSNALKLKLTDRDGTLSGSATLRLGDLAFTATITGTYKIDTEAMALDLALEDIGEETKITYAGKRSTPTMIEGKMAMTDGDVTISLTRLED
ncbi:MAG: hypothetical protein OXG58_04350 [Gemmatimonadetes bacterium]|nr:hypothetical protein [Gemmatimonadota bacterium]MCY3943190.1 hypothetical protein [Gemmatimonadota bacterium]